MASRRQTRRRREGFTLIEVMIVIILMALVASGVSYAFGALERTQLRSSCVRIAAAARYAYNRAISHGSTVRVVLDLERHTIGFEEAHGRVTLARTSDSRRRDLERDDPGADAAAVDPWAAAQARLADTLRPSFGASPFSALEGRRYETRPIGDGITIEQLITPHEPDPRDDGRGAIYFFPGGQTEHAVVWLSDGGDRVFSVEIHPLTGRARIRDSAYEPEDLLDDSGRRPTSEVEER